MNLIFLGAPGVGKGTQARFLAKVLNVPHISTGEIFRNNMREETALGMKIKSFMDSGNLVPDSMVVDVIAERLAEEDCNGGFILDGVPRTIPQAEFLDTKINVEKVVNFILPEEEIVRRITGRRTCKQCGFAHHIEYLPPKKEGLCDKCGGNLVQRSDETRNAVERRLEEYSRQTAPLAEYYSKQDKLIDIDASPSIEEIHKIVCKELELKCD